MKIKTKLVHVILILKLKLQMSCLIAMKFKKLTKHVKLEVVAESTVAILNLQV